MKTLIHRLGSMKIAVVLLVVILAAMAAGTIVESSRGTDAAARAVYGAAWFRVLLGLFACNVLCSIVDLFPWGRARIGFVLTHGSMLVILAGALVTDRVKQEGSLALWEGEQSAVVETTPAAGSGAPAGHFTLPFSVRLDAFEIDYYQGTHRPAMFRSRVTVTDPAAGPRAAVIEMNHELSYAGYRFFQSSYQQTMQGQQSVLLVSRDPGQPIVFTGYVLLMAGMGTVLFTRVAQQRALARVAARKPAARPGRRAIAAGLLGAALLVPHGAVRAQSAGAEAVDPSVVRTIRRLPVQRDGRVMPFDTVAREAVWKVSGGTLPYGGAIEEVLGWTFDPDRAADRLLIAVPASIVAAAALPAGTRLATYRELTDNPRLLSLMQDARAAEDQERPLDGLQRDAQKVEERLSVMQEFLHGTALRVVPARGAGTAWTPAQGPHGPGDLAALVSAGPTADIAVSSRFGWELAYNASRPARLAWMALALSLALSFLAWKTAGRGLDAAAGAAAIAAFAAMTFGLAARWVAAGRIPASNMYESLLFLGWGVGLFAVIAAVFLRSRLVLVNAAARAALTMALVDLLPIDPFIHPMPPVLSGTPWLAIHVPIIMISYSVLAIGVLVAHVQVAFTIAAPGRRDLALRMNDLLYWYIHIGSFLLIAGILTGSIWAASSWGRYWGWDPKEVWSLVAFFAYLAILHGRFDRLIGPFGVAVLSIVAFWTILMTYIGVNFVLTTGMHSYGTGSAAVVRSMLVVAAAEGVFLFFGLMSQVAADKRRRGSPRPA